VAQSAGHWTLGFSLGHDPRVVGLSPKSGSIPKVESTWESIPLPLPLPLPAHTLSLSNNLKKKKKDSSIAVVLNN